MLVCLNGDVKIIDNDTMTKKDKLCSDMSEVIYSIVRHIPYKTQQPHIEIISDTKKKHRDEIRQKIQLAFSLTDNDDFKMAADRSIAQSENKYANLFNHNPILSLSFRPG